MTVGVRRKHVELLVCPNLAGIGTRYVITTGDWKSKRQRAAAMKDLEGLITEAFAKAKTREVLR